MLGKVKKTIERYQMIRSGDRVLVAVSGGPDSVALLAALAKLAPELGCCLVAAHLNHGLRPEGDDEEKLVRAFCLSLGLPLESARADILALSRARGKSIEDTAREVRYLFLQQAAARVRADRIALGHHRRDQAETVLMNLLRGSGPEGLKGMQPVRDGRFIRPLLYTPAAEILVFLAREGLPFAADSSNMDRIYFRNRIRHDLLPLLDGQYKGGIERILARTAEITGQEDDFMQDQVRRILSGWNIADATDNLCLEIAKLRELHVALTRRVIKVLLERFSPDEKGVFHSHVQGVIDLAFTGKPSGRLHLPFAVEVRRDYGLLILRRREEGGQGGDYSCPVVVPGRMVVPAVKMVLEFTVLDAGHREIMELMPEKGQCSWAEPQGGQDYLDYDQVTFPLTIRNIRPGDRMRPLGMEGTKKVKAIFIDKKVSRDYRHRVPLLASDEGILWIAGVCMSEAVRITSGTRRVLKVSHKQVKEKSIEIRERLL